MQLRCWHTNGPSALLSRMYLCTYAREALTEMNVHYKLQAVSRADGACCQEHTRHYIYEVAGNGVCRFCFFFRCVAAAAAAAGAGAVDG